MLAKVVAWAPTRAEAARCSPAPCPGPRCTASSPTATCWSPPARPGLPRGRGQHRLLRASRHRADGRAAASRRAPALRGRGGAGRAGPADAHASRRAIPGRLAQRRLPAAAHRVRVARFGDERRSTSSSGTAAATATPPPTATCGCWPHRPHGVTIEVDRISTRVGRDDRRTVASGSARRLRRRPAGVACTCVALPRFVDPADVVAQGSLLAPMPGTVIGVPLEAGAEVTAGQTVLVLEAMKMQHTISAPTDGVLTEVAVALGDQVAAGRRARRRHAGRPTTTSPTSSAEGDQP